MGAKSKIEWTDSTWNPVTGCDKVSPGCDNCYAESFSERFRGTEGNYWENGFDLQVRPLKLDQPKRWTKSRVIFVNSMSDLFHKEIPDSYRDQVFDVMEQADHHIYQVLTKRSSLMRNYVNKRYRDQPAPLHIWLGVSVEDLERMSRITHLKQTKAHVRFLSCEPLLEDIGAHLDLSMIDWVIVGGESGANHRTLEPHWAHAIKCVCEIHGVPFFFKQWSGRTSKANGNVLGGRQYLETPPIEFGIYKE